MRGALPGLPPAGLSFKFAAAAGGAGSLRRAGHPGRSGADAGPGPSGSPGARGWQQGGPQQARRREHPGLRVEAGGSNNDSAEVQPPGQVLPGARLCAQLPAEHRNITKAHIDRGALWRDACSPNSTSVALLASEGGLTLR